MKIMIKNFIIIINIKRVNNKMIRRLCRPAFRYVNQKSKRLPVQQQNHEYYKDANLPIDQKLLTKIDLSKIGLDYMPDSHQLQNVPQLKHGLDKFLNGQLVMGDYGVGNLPSLDQNKNSAIREVTSYTDPSNDQSLHATSKITQCRYVSSTSNISNPLICLYYIFSSFRTPQLDNIYSSWLNKPSNWIISMRKPTSFYLHKINENCDSISSDKGVLPVQHQVLLNLGHLVEYLLTHEKQETSKLLSGQKVPILKNYYRYVNVNKEITLRSQIDCKSYDKNGKPYVFEIKSRACAPIRYDVENYKKYLDYEINSRRGDVESFQRQYYDLIRSGFLKYAMQVKIGKMNGAFIAYHNTEKIYGYEYVDLKQMALRVFGDEYNLDVSFLCVSKMLTIVLDHLRKSLPQHKNDSLKIGFYSQFKYRKLVVLVEGMSITKQYIPLQAQNKEIKSIIDYYTKYTKLKNPIYKFQFDFLIYVNGFLVQNPQILLTPHDNVEIKYKVTDKMPISQEEYIVFLSQAYKDQQVFSSHLYRGVWNNIETNID